MTQRPGGGRLGAAMVEPMLAQARRCGRGRQQPKTILHHFRWLRAHGARLPVPHWLARMAVLRAAGVWSGVCPGGQVGGSRPLLVKRPCRYGVPG